MLGFANSVLLLILVCKQSKKTVKPMTHRSESQDDMNRSTRDCVFWKINPDSGIQRGIGGEKK